jgi:hypothetical protein
MGDEEGGRKDTTMMCASDSVSVLAFLTLFLPYSFH